jgi:type I restriction enzyme S subunit
MTSVLDDIEIAPGWKEIPFKAIAEKVSESGFPELEPLSVYLEAGVVPRSSRDDNHNQLGESLEKYQRVLPQDLVFNKLRTWQGGFGISSHEGIVSPAYIIARPNLDLIDPTFLGYLLKSKPYLAELTRLSKWMPPTQFDIAWESIRDLRLRLPDIKEQERISAFLDKQITLINRAIALRLKELALRTEYERRIIDDFLEPHPKIKMKYVCEDSGQYGLNIAPEEYRSEGIRLLRTSDFGSRDVEPIFVTGPLEDRFLVKQGDILLTRSGATIGQSFLVGQEEEGSSFAGFLIRFRCNEDYSPEFLSIVCNSTGFQDQVAIDATVSTIPNFNADKYANIEIPHLDKAEQLKLIQAISRATEKHVKLMEPLNLALSLLNELKLSLITNLVTGRFGIEESGNS